MDFASQLLQGFGCFGVDEQLMGSNGSVFAQSLAMAEPALGSYIHFQILLFYLIFVKSLFFNFLKIIYFIFF